MSHMMNCVSDNYQIKDNINIVGIEFSAHLSDNFTIVSAP